MRKKKFICLFFKKKKKKFSGSDDPHQLVPTRRYVGQPKQAGGQPFSLEISRKVILLTDFHAHLSAHEVIGFLAGSWNSVTQGKKKKKIVC